MKKLVVIGGGAAGFFCAVTAARLAPQLEIILLEKSGRLLSKVSVSGGGRCNVTHALFDNDAFAKNYPRGAHFVKKALYQFSAKDTVNWFQERGVAIKQEKDGRMFPQSNTSQTIIDCLLNEARTYGVHIRLQSGVEKIEKKEGVFHIHLQSGQSLASDFVCIACGGFPKASQFEWIKNLGHNIVTPLPSLFTFNLPQHPVNALMGVSVPDVKLKIEGSKLQQTGPLLITHWGLSGPAVLRLSAWGARDLAEALYHFKVHINWLPQQGMGFLKSLIDMQRRQHPAQKVANFSEMKLPQRLWMFLLQEAGIEAERKWADLPAKKENHLLQLLTDYLVEVQGKTTFKEEFVTAGGVQLSEIDAHTMQSKKLEGLYFSGEIMDVDGITGGFNFQHAWTSGFVAGKNIAQASVGN